MRSRRGPLVAPSSSPCRFSNAIATQRDCSPPSMTCRSATSLRLSRRFWSDGDAALPPVEAAYAMAQAILAEFSRVQDDSEESETVEGILNRSLHLTSAASDETLIA